MNVTFGSTKGAEVFTAEVEPYLTGEAALIELQMDHGQGPFLPPPAKDRPYLLTIARTQNQIAPKQEFGEAGVIDGDFIQVWEAVIGQ